MGLGVIWLASHEGERVPFQSMSESVQADDWPQESQMELLARPHDRGRHALQQTGYT